MGDNIYDMHYGASAYTFELAKKLRNNMTNTENILWEHLKDKKILGLKFRRQHPLNRFIADFYCHEIKLVVELDGKIHLQKKVFENDKERQSEIEDFGISVIRFTNDEVFNDLQNVLQKIESKCGSLLNA